MSDKAIENTKGQAVDKAAQRAQDVERQLQEIKLKSAELELEDLTTRVERDRAQRKGIMLAYEAQMRTLDENNRQIVAEQSICKHRKGGKGLQGILNGHDSNYAVIKHTFPWGAVRVSCTRCDKSWSMPAIELKKSNPAEYKRLLEEYKWAMDLPTDNEPSGTQLFIIHSPAPKQQRATA